MRQKTTPFFLFILILLTLTVTGCIRYTDHPSVPQPENAVTATSFMSNGYEITRIHFDGHQYIEFKRTARNTHMTPEVSPSVLHDPDCPCQADMTTTIAQGIDRTLEPLRNITVKPDMKKLESLMHPLTSIRPIPALSGKD